jgi:hypothetical protein
MFCGIGIVSTIGRMCASMTENHSIIPVIFASNIGRLIIISSHAACIWTTMRTESIGNSVYLYIYERL